MSEIQYVDSPEVLDSETLWRVVAPNYLHFDPSGLEIKISEGAFRTQEMSVFRSSKITVEEVLRRFPPGSLVVEFLAKLARDPSPAGAGCILVLDPDDSSHVMVCPKEHPSKRLTGGQATIFRRGVTPLNPPPIR